MRVDMVFADDGWFGLYLDGVLRRWCHEDPWYILEQAALGKTITALKTHGFGDYGIAAVEWEEAAGRFEDIPAAWWTNDDYEPPTFDGDDQ